MHVCRRLAQGMLVIAWLFGSAHGQSSEHLSSPRFQQQLAAPASIFWDEVPISSAISELSRTQRMHCWLDRRLDPSMPISFSSQQAALGKSLLQLATDNENLDIAWIGDVLIFGPKDAAERVATVHRIHRDRLDAMQSRFHRTAWINRKTMRWDKLATPRILVDRLERELESDIAGKDLVPHDLWNGGILQDLPLYVRLELVLSGFDLTFAFRSDGGARIIRMPEQPVATWKLKIPRDRRDTVKEIVLRQPAAALDGDRLTASWTTYQLVKQALVDDNSDNETLDNARYTLKAQNQQVGPFLQNLCKQLGLECRFDNVDSVELQRRVSFEVREVRLEALLQKAVETTPLSATLTGTTLIVQKKISED